MLGAIIGDIVGSRWEFNPTNDYNFELFSDKNGFTDDTICTVAVADAILHGSDDYGKFIHKWCRKYPNPMGGYGGRFRQWVLSDNPKPYGSFGNGSAMRVSPVGWMFGINDGIFEQAKKSAECTHNHEEGIKGAMAVATAVNECLKLRRENPDKQLTAQEILDFGLYHALYEYTEVPWKFKLDIEQYRNKFDETCQGTVPVALWIVMNSKSFEDAIRQAVSLGADADTLGAIVGSIAEALWGIPEWMKQKAMSYLPDDMKAVVLKFRERLNRMRQLAGKCEYFKVGEFVGLDDKEKKAYDIESEWAHDLAKSWLNADKIKAEMQQICFMKHWKQWADEYDLPVSLIGYIFKHTANSGMFMHEMVEPFEEFLRNAYGKRKEGALKKKVLKEKLEQHKALLFWKLANGNVAKILNGEDGMPDKSKAATRNSWQIGPMPKDSQQTSVMPANIILSHKNMEVLRKGHIPEAQEDHWFMYCDHEYIRYYRSWTGMCAFEARIKYSSVGEAYYIDKIRINHALAEFGVNGDLPAAHLFMYLIAAEVGGDAASAWKDFIKAWEELAIKQSESAH